MTKTIGEALVWMDAVLAGLPVGDGAVRPFVLPAHTALAAVRDHPLRANEPASGIAAAALMVSRAALVASPSDLAAAAQHLPDIADDLFGAARRWTENTLYPRTSPLPGERRRPATLERAIARISGSLDAASTLSVVLADDLGHLQSPAGDDLGPARHLRGVARWGWRTGREVGRRPGGHRVATGQELADPERRQHDEDRHEGGRPEPAASPN